MQEKSGTELVVDRRVIWYEDCRWKGKGKVDFESFLLESSILTNQKREVESPEPDELKDLGFPLVTSRMKPIHQGDKT